MTVYTMLSGGGGFFCKLRCVFPAIVFPGSIASSCISLQCTARAVQALRFHNGQSLSFRIPFPSASLLSPPSIQRLTVRAPGTLLWPVAADCRGITSQPWPAPAGVSVFVVANEPASPTVRAPAPLPPAFPDTAPACLVAAATGRSVPLAHSGAPS